ncbi:hypothetical protein C8N47_105133 [Mangrovibacterium marinum]|uniref:Uncharacterized protein n=1 Tax=Mangrovibacterium marinum TaxID=1639118 RepID=A0A2T5C3D4_9BACT|nr:hypothetical protein [Mangrovibacterium marinum]PTN09292.1 hypothetical protein C8N47_105133 [Mangrovibacterium marinum]
MNNNLPAINNTNSDLCGNYGLELQASYLAPSGFNYQAGVRELDGLIIVEAVAEGVGCTYLCGIRVLNKADNTLVAEINVPRNVHYSRQKCVDLVSKELVDLLVNAATKGQYWIDREAALRKINTLLDNCYFEQSRKSILIWAESLGII